MTAHSNVSRPHGGVILPVRRPRMDGPIASEIRTGLSAIAAEARRMIARVRIQRALRSIEREEMRAIHEVDWLREELVQQERNLTWLEMEHRERREALTTRLQQLEKVPQ